LSLLSYNFLSSSLTRALIMVLKLISSKILKIKSY
jgi:hypothetical protein